jgi:uncharacterized repeat protein (TIGR01451 family)
MTVKPNTRLRFLPTAVALAAGLCGLLAATAAAQEPVNADIAIVSKTANARHAKVGQLVTFTILATNNGPEPSQLDVFDQPLIGLHMVEETCDRGISPDTPACEYSQVQPGESVTTTVVAEVDGGVGKYATNTACVSNESGLPDPDPSNDCATTTVRIIGSGTSPR